jgi:hypothetical protein
MLQAPPEAVAPAAATTSRPNKRRCRRQTPKSNLKVRAFKSTLGLGANIALAILDISENGVRLLLKENLPVGHSFEVTLEPVSCKTVKTIAEVVWSIPAADGTFCVGTRFQKNLPYSDLALLARP